MVYFSRRRVDGEIQPGSSGTHAAHLHTFRSSARGQAAHRRFRSVGEQGSSDLLGRDVATLHLRLVVDLSPSLEIGVLRTGEDQNAQNDVPAAPTALDLPWFVENVIEWYLL